MTISNIYIENWKQFEKVDIDFHPKITFLTGINGSGKTTILNILSTLFKWTVHEFFEPTHDERNQLKNKQKKTTIGILKISENDENYNIELQSYGRSGIQRNIKITPNPNLQGLLLSASRKPLVYKMPVTSSPTSTLGDKYIFNEFIQTYKADQSELGLTEQANIIKRTLINWIITGYGNPLIEAQPQNLEKFEQFENLLKNTLPSKIGFEKFDIKNGNLYLSTISGKFVLEAVSGGISSLVEFLWVLFLLDKIDSNQNKLVLIDEPENHLHGSMQREIIPNLCASFPNIQFIVATHSPLIVSSMKDSAVYVLDFNESNKVISRELDILHKAKTASEVLQDVLGVPFTMPIWVEKELEQIEKKYNKLEITETTYHMLKKDLTSIGLGDYLPETLGKIIIRKEENDKNK